MFLLFSFKQLNYRLWPNDTSDKVDIRGTNVEKIY